MQSHQLYRSHLSTVRERLTLPLAESPEAVAQIRFDAGSQVRRYVGGRAQERSAADDGRPQLTPHQIAAHFGRRILQEIPAHRQCHADHHYLRLPDRPHNAKSSSVRQPLSCASCVCVIPLNSRAKVSISGLTVLSIHLSPTSRLHCVRIPLSTTRFLVLPVDCRHQTCQAVALHTNAIRLGAGSRDQLPRGDAQNSLYRTHTNMIAAE